MLWRYPKDDPWLVVDLPRAVGWLLAEVAAYRLWGAWGLVFVVGLALGCGSFRR
jgi:hypothetical protein